MIDSQIASEMKNPGILFRLAFNECGSYTANTPEQLIQIERIRGNCSWLVFTLADFVCEPPAFISKIMSFSEFDTIIGDAYVLFNLV